MGLTLDKRDLDSLARGEALILVKSSVNASNRLRDLGYLLTPIAANILNHEFFLQDLDVHLINSYVNG